MEEKDIKNELWTLYEQAKESDDLETALAILDRIELRRVCCDNRALEDDRRK